MMKFWLQWIVETVWPAGRCPEVRCLNSPCRCLKLPGRCIVWIYLCTYATRSKVPTKKWRWSCETCKLNARFLPVVHVHLLKCTCIMQKRHNIMQFHHLFFPFPLCCLIYDWEPASILLSKTYGLSMVANNNTKEKSWNDCGNCELFLSFPWSRCLCLYESLHTMNG